QFWTDVVWGPTDVMFIDMPPGTGDVPLTVFQSIPLDGILIVTSPQDLVSMIVGKAVKMAQMMDIPVLGLIENYSYFLCPHCGEKMEPFGRSRAEETAESFGIPAAVRLPVDPKLAAAADAGTIELFEGDWLDGLLPSLLPDDLDA
ncbi:MAG: P-loop NTPase, partial [Clostridia bacterium]|nr:P-loop NTPase [Clostridia bacterium]